ncbi:MAG: NIPSNAP family protein [Blastocatellia bacterium]|nr:NIPSNAP family protein [Blastocatellia bacterium]
MFIRFFLVTTILSIISTGVSAQSAKPAQPAGPAPLTPAPSPSLAKDSRCFEIRTYTASPGKLEELHARFRNHTLKIFKKHGMKVVGFWGPVDKEKGSENKLVYILAFPSREAREKAWKDFNDDPEWKTVKTESEKNGKIVDNVESVILQATDYSPVK